MATNLQPQKYLAAYLKDKKVDLILAGNVAIDEGLVK